MRNLKNWVMLIALLTILLIPFTSGLDSAQAKNTDAPIEAVLPAPIPILPSGTTYTSMPTYSWYARAGATYYGLLLDETTTLQYTPTQAHCAAGTGKCYVTPSIALRAGAHYWRVRARNASGNGPYNASKIYIYTTTPLAPVLLTPKDYAAVTASPQFTWKPSTGATRYWLQINNGWLSFSYSSTQVHCPTTTTNCYIKPPIVLSSNTYTWRVSAYNAYGYGTWTLPRRFSVQ